MTSYLGCLFGLQRNELKKEDFTLIFRVPLRFLGVSAQGSSAVGSVHYSPVVSGTLVENNHTESTDLPSVYILGFICRSASEEHNCVETGSQEPMAIYFTSGTTGSPKMAQHSQGSLGIGYTLCGR
jgi:acyl-coenzyme A synthetase/AMP-(fatty) acid ligase